MSCNNCCNSAGSMFPRSMKRRGHLAHQRDAVSMSHLFALMLQLKVGLFLRANIQSHANGFQKVPFLILQTAPALNYPSRFSIRQTKTVLAFERPGKSTRTIISRFDICSLVGMDTGED